MALSRDEVLEGALRLLDAEGLDALTMRRLADRLGVRAGAIYWHFDGKQALLDAMADRLMEGVLEPPPRGRWDGQLAELSRRTAAALASRRDGARLATSALQPGEHGLRVSERMLHVAREAGFSPTRAVWATSVLGYYVLGYVTDVQATEAAKAHGLRAILRSLRQRLDRRDYPELSRFAGDLDALMTPRAFAARFEFGLQAILRGLADARSSRRTFGAAGRSAGAPRRRRRPPPPRPRGRAR